MLLNIPHTIYYVKAIQSRAWRIHLQQFFKDLDSEKPRICVVSHFRNLENTQKKIVTHRLHHIKTRNRKGYENHVITLYSVVFLLQILPDFSGVQSGFDRDLVKMRSIFGAPLSCGKNGKMGKISAFFWENGHIAQNTEKEYVQCDLLFQKVGTKIISLNAATIKRTSISKSNSRRLQNQC